MGVPISAHSKSLECSHHDRTAVVFLSCIHTMHPHHASTPSQRGRVPIVVGGTGFYLRWFTNGKAQGPRATPEAVEAVKEALRKVLICVCSLT